MTWSRSETFAHAFVVPPISLWLIWRQRKILAGLLPDGSLRMALVVVLAAVGWLLGDLVVANAVTQYAMVATIVLAVPAVLGLRVARVIAFPLAFLFFAVPAGEFTLPTMMDWTAKFTVIALRATGIPVYQEGLHFVIPSGNWSVVEACSGVRYLIASVVVGTLFAYLNYRSLKRRLIFVGVSILVPIIANWLRAYMIVMLGHLSSNKLAVGADHLIYGWVFFGLVITIMFVIGARWAEDTEPHPVAAGEGMAGVGSAARSLAWPAALLVAAIAVAPRIANETVFGTGSSDRPRLELEGEIGDWKRTEAFAAWQPRFTPPVAELRRSFQAGERKAAIHVSYYRNQDYHNKLVSSSNVLVASNDKLWTRSRIGGRELAVGADKLQVPETELRGPDGQRLLVWQWYWIDGRITTSDIRAKLYNALARLRGHGDDAAHVLLYAPVEQPGGATAAMESLLQTAWPSLETALQGAGTRK